MDYKRLGDYIREVNVRNRDLKVTTLVGLTIDKAFIPSVANVIGTDLSNYKVIRREQFACSLMQVSRDGKMPVAMFEEDEAIMSPAYPMFEVVDKTVLLPQYLMMWFSRSEFDREASYYAVGGVRGSLTWEDFCNMKLPVPDIARQREIVAEYETLSSRIRLNEQMIEKQEATAQALYRKMFVDGVDMEHLPEGWRRGTIGDVVAFLNGYAFKSETYVPNGRYKIITIKGVQDGYLSLEKAETINIIPGNMPKHCHLKVGDILISLTGNVGRTCIVNTDNLLLNQRVAILEPRNSNDKMFVYLMFKQEKLRSTLQAMAGGTAQDNLSPVDTSNLDYIIPPRESLDEFYIKTGEIMRYLISLTKGRAPDHPPRINGFAIARPAFPFYTR